ncbi:hypothetical protein CI610_01789 [invertebrate metagenome]|uniref:CRISPR-associated protein Csd1 n=1 Tax=invertebrate metagenome TaxID=1711999 RepID=A0A2H9T7P5_9ZZZZ
MILQSLCNFYHRHDITLSPYGFEHQAIPFIVVINDKGDFVEIIDTRRLKGKHKVPESFLVPQTVKKTSRVTANLLWDVSEYALGVDFKNNPEKTGSQFEAFKSRLEPYREHSEVALLCRFLESLDEQNITSSEHWDEIKKSNPKVSFLLEGSDSLICQSERFTRLYIQKLGDDAGVISLPCLITGQKADIALLHPAIKYLHGAQSSGTNIVSFNSPAFTSWSKKQGVNAPVSKKAAFEYTAALNYLLANKEYHFRIGNITGVFWSEEQTDIGKHFREVFVDNPDSDDGAVEQAYERIQEINANKNHAFHVLGLAPSNARISICYWYRLSIAELQRALRLWHQDVEIVGMKTFGHPSFEWMLRCLCRGNKIKYLPDRYSTDLMGAVLTGAQVPHTIMMAVLDKVRKYKIRVNDAHVGLLKVCLNRKYRTEGRQDMQLKVRLDEQNCQPGYVLGRLFSVFERLQEEAHRSRLSATIASRYYSGASIRPQTVFNALFQLHIHHLRKLRNPGRVNNFRKMISDLMQKIDEIPSNLSSEQQSLFAVGYYHQRQSFYSSDKDMNADSEDSDEFE